MTDDEKKEFFAMVRKDDGLRDNMVAVARLLKGMRQVGQLVDNEVQGAFWAANAESLKLLVSKVVREAKKEARRKALFAWRGAAAIAASVLLVLFSGYKLVAYNNTVGLGEQYAMAYVETGPSRGGEDERVVAELKTLFANVVEKSDLANTTQRLSLLFELSIMDVYNDYTDFSPEIALNLAAAYLKGNDAVSAKAVLSRFISRNAGSPSAHKAQELLDKINEL